jgi:hypothetical protein
MVVVVGNVSVVVVVVVDVSVVVVVAVGDVSVAVGVVVGVVGAVSVAAGVVTAVDDPEGVDVLARAAVEDVVAPASATVVRAAGAPAVRAPRDVVLVAGDIAAERTAGVDGAGAVDASLHRAAIVDPATATGPRRTAGRESVTP